MRHVYWGLGSSCRSVSHDVTGRRAQAIEFHETGLTIADRMYPEVVWWDVHNGHFLWLIHFFQRGDWSAAVTALTRGERLVKALPEWLAFAIGTVFDSSWGLSHLVKGERDAASCLETMRASLIAAERAAHHVYTGISQLLLGHAYVTLGEHDRALTHFAVALSLSEQVRIFRPGALLWTAETQARLGQLDEALELLRLYEQLIEQIGSGEGLAWFPSQGAADRVHGLVAAQRGQHARATEHFLRSVDVLAHHGYRPDLARTYAALARLHRDHGRAGEARQAFKTAIEHFRVMGFGRELELTRAEGEL
jgi:tetratricopeptide (TPR) repeat protein